MHPLHRLFRPGRTGCQRDSQHQGNHEAVAGEQKRQWLGIGQAEFSPDKTGAPQKYKEKRVEAPHQLTCRAGASKLSRKV